MLIGYARCSTNRQDLRAQKNQLRELGVEDRRIYTDFGYTGRTRDRPGLREAMAATHSGDTLIVTKLDRLARSVEDAKAIARELQQHWPPDSQRHPAWPAQPAPITGTAESPGSLWGDVT